MSEVQCPTCRTVIDTSKRCVAGRGAGQCMESQGHFGWHWTDVGSTQGILRWTGDYFTYGCPGRMDLNRWCVKPYGHDRSHNDGRGVSFSDPMTEEEWNKEYGEV